MVGPPADSGSRRIAKPAESGKSGELVAKPEKTDVFTGFASITVAICDELHAI